MTGNTRTTADVRSLSQDEVRQIERERQLIEQARASIEAGHFLTDGEIDHMVDSDQPMPIPDDDRRMRKVGR